MWKNKRQAPAITELAMTAARNVIESTGGSPVNRGLAAKVISLESLNEAEFQELDHASASVSLALESAFSTDDVILTQAQKAAGVIAATVCSDMSKAINAPVTPSLENFNGSITVGALTKRPSLEAYDERENRNAATFTVAYNLLAARQDDFGETLFPTVVQAPDQAGFSVSIQLIQVMDDLRREVSGSFLENMGRKNIIKALIDPTILRNDMLRAIPVRRDENKVNFVDAAVIAPTNIDYEGNKFATAPLAIGRRFDLLALSQHDALLQTGLMDTTDALDNYMALTAIYVTIPNKAGDGKEVLKFSNLEHNQAALFTYKPAGNYRDMQLNFTTAHLPVTKNIKTIAGAAPTALDTFIAAEQEIHLNVGVFGESNLQTGITRLQGHSVELFRLSDKDGNVLNITAGAGKTLADLFAKAEIIGYDLIARRVNSNLRERGQLIDTTYQNQLYAVPLLSPITSLRPMTTGDNRDAADLNALLQATRIRTSNAAVAKLLEADAVLQEYQARNGIVSHDDTGLLGVARLLITPHYERQVLDVKKEINSVTSAERAADLQAVLVNKVRDMVYRAWRDSGYKIAKEALNGGVATMPTVIIATDPVIARYLQVTGDFRTISGEFEVRIVSTLNQNMRGKLFITFGDFTSNTEGAPNPMHFGNMAWKPELSLVLPLHRNGANSKELSVAPSFLHIVNLPILMQIEIQNLSEAFVNNVAIQVGASSIAPVHTKNVQ